MEQLKISLCVYHKNPDRQNSSYYARMRFNGKTTDIPLNTKDRGVAESWVRLRRSEIQRYNDYVLVGEEPPSDLLSKLPINGTKTVRRASVTLRQCYYSFELDMRRRGLRNRSIEAYMKNLRLTVPLDEPLSAVTRDSLRLWMSKHDSLRSATRKHYSVALHEFCKYLVDSYGVDPRVIANWPKIKVEHVEKGFWKMHEIYHIIDAVECKNKLCERQMKVYLWTLALCGSRQGETALLKWSDLKDGCLTFRAENTKTNKTRVVPVDMRLLDMINRLPHDSDFIFSNIPSSQAGRYTVLERAVKKSGMPQGGLHQLRRSCCYYLYGHCNDVKAVSQVLGNSPATAMDFYVKSRQSDTLRELIDSAYSEEHMIPSPLDRLLEEDLL